MELKTQVQIQHLAAMKDSHNKKMDDNRAAIESTQNEIWHKEIEHVILTNSISEVEDHYAGVEKLNKLNGSIHSLKDKLFKLESTSFKNELAYIKAIDAKLRELEPKVPHALS